MRPREIKRAVRYLDKILKDCSDEELTKILSLDKPNRIWKPTDAGGARSPGEVS